MELFETALTQGIAPAIVVALYLIVVKIIDTKKEKNQIKINSEVTDSIKALGVYMMQFTKDVIDKDRNKCKNCIEDTLNASAFKFVQFMQRTLLANHLEDNKDLILSNIHEIATSEYYTVYSALNLYKINGTNVADYLDKNWIKDVEQDLVDCIYKPKTKNEDKLISFTNKISLKFGGYITYIANKSLK